MNANLDRRSSRRIASTDALCAPWSHVATAITRVVVEPRRLPTFFGTPIVAHALSPRVDESGFTSPAIETPGGHSPAYDRAPRQRGRDPHTAFARRMVQGLLTTFPSTVRLELSRGVTWVAVALYESVTPTVRLDPSAAPDAGSSIVVGTIDVEYQLVIAAGATALRDWRTLHATAVAAPATAWPPPRR
jgi:hypothetical protein